MAGRVGVTAGLFAGLKSPEAPGPIEVIGRTQGALPASGDVAWHAVLWRCFVDHDGLRRLVMIKFYKYLAAGIIGKTTQIGAMRYPDRDRTVNPR